MLIKRQSSDITCCPDSPLVTAWHSYSQQPRQNLTLELVCTVTAFPAAKVAWAREAGGEVAVERYRVELHEDQEDEDTVRHLLLIDNPSPEVRPGLTAGGSDQYFLSLRTSRDPSSARPGTVLD